MSQQNGARNEDSPEEVQAPGRGEDRLGNLLLEGAWAAAGSRVAFMVLTWPIGGFLASPILGAGGALAALSGSGIGVAVWLTDWIAGIVLFVAALVAAQRARTGGHGALRRIRPLARCYVVLSAFHLVTALLLPLFAVLVELLSAVGVMEWSDGDAVVLVCVYAAVVGAASGGPAVAAFVYAINIRAGIRHRLQQVQPAGP